MMGATRAGHFDALHVRRIQASTRPMRTMSDVEHAPKPTNLAENLELLVLVHTCRPQPHHPCSLSQTSRPKSKQTRRFGPCGSQTHTHTVEVAPHQLHALHSCYGGPGGVHRHQTALWKQQDQHGRPTTPPCGCRCRLLPRRWRRHGESSATSSATIITCRCAQSSRSMDRTPRRRCRGPTPCGRRHAAGREGTTRILRHK